MKRIARTDDWTKPKVRELLGQPDDVWISTDSKRYINMPDGEVWCYGTNGHHTLPTLGAVTFRGNNVLFTNYSDTPPSPNLISEDELRKTMRRMHQFSSDDRFEDGAHSIGDPLQRIRAANTLIPLGTQKAIAVLKEYCRVIPMWSDDENFPFWLVRSVFRGKKPGYKFPVPRIGMMSPQPPTDLAIWPTYPVVNVANFPFLIYLGAMLAGFAEPFEWYARDHESEWEIVDNKLIPPNDPFALFDEVLKQRGLESEDKGRIKEVIASNILRAVRNVAKLKISRYEVTSEEFEKLHQQFLKLKPHWDNKLGLYVRGDGTYDKDPNIEYQQTTIKFSGMKNLKVDATISRTGELGVDVNADTYESGSELIKPAILEIIDVDAGKQVGFFVINGQVSVNETKESVLRIPAHKPSPGGMGFGTGFDLPAGHKMKLILTYDGKAYESKVWVP